MAINPTVVKTAMRIAGTVFIALGSALAAPWGEVFRSIGIALGSLTVNVDPSLVKATDIGAIVNAANKSLPEGSTLKVTSIHPPPVVTLTNTKE